MQDSLKKLDPDQSHIGPQVWRGDSPSWTQIGTMQNISTPFLQGRDLFLPQT